MTEPMYGLFHHSIQCLTCNLERSDVERLHALRAAGASFESLSTETAKMGGPISADALSNHFRRHAVQELKPLLGVISPDEARKNFGVIAAGPVSTSIATPPKGWGPRVEMGGDAGYLVSTPQTDDKISDFSEILAEMGLDPKAFEVVGAARISKWQQKTTGEWLTAYRVSVRKSSTIVDISDILDIVKDVKPQPSITRGEHAFVFAAGDLQLGKCDGDGVEGTVRRYRESLQKAVNKVHEHRDEIGPILISFVGDCIEGMVSQKGKNARRTVLTTTQQVHLLRKLMIETIKAFAPLTDSLRVVSVPGNHDEAQREPVSTDGSDSWAVDALRAVAQGLAFNPEAFGHVVCEEVSYDELTKVVEVAGTKIGHAHGHQWSRGKHWDWWSGQHWGGHEIGQADILLCGHFHTGMYEQENFKHIIRTPAFEQESTYFRHRTGKVGNPSAVTFLTKDRKLKYIDFE